VREFSPDGKECRIFHSRCAPDELDDVENVLVFPLITQTLRLAAVLREPRTR
jgi:hypothetical protein